MADPPVTVRPMTNEESGVFVCVSMGADDQTLPQGRSIRVIDGHLYVLSGNPADSDIVAVFAPGKWIFGKILFAAATSSTRS